MLRITNKNFYKSLGASIAPSEQNAKGSLTAQTLPKGRRRDALFLFSALLAILALTAAPLHADDFSEGFGGGFSSDEPAAESNSSSETQPATQLEWGGFVSTTMRSYIDTDDPGDSPVTTYPEVGLDLHYSAKNSEAVANLRFHRNWLYDAGLEQQASGHQNVLWYLQQMIDEAYLRLFYDNFNLQAGFLKEVWGTGDQSHVVDLLNPTDYYDYVNIDYIDRKTAEFMFKLNIPFAMNGLVELAYVPTFTPDSSPLYGDWAPQSVSQITSIIETDSLTLNQPDTNTISNGQAALRVSGTAGGMDVAGTYYFGYLRQPGLDITYTGTPPNLVPAKADLSYDRVHVFGLDGAGVLAGFNLRGEAAYYLTEDYEGDDETRLNNHSVQYVAGFDRNLPVSQLNLNIQTIGAYFINEDDDPTRTIVSAALSDSWNNDKIRPEFSASYGVEEEDWMIRPEVTFDLVDDVELTAGGAIFLGSSDGRFGQFEDNNYAEVELTYNF